MISLDNVVTIPANLLGRTVGFLSSEQEMLLAKAIVLAYDLDIEAAATAAGHGLAFGRADVVDDDEHVMAAGKIKAVDI